jgi:hypothetical protein
MTVRVAHVILLPNAPSAMLPGAFLPSPSDLIVSRKAEGQSDAGSGRQRSSHALRGLQLAELAQFG